MHTCGQTNPDSSLGIAVSLSIAGIPNWFAHDSPVIIIIKRYCIMVAFYGQRDALAALSVDCS